MIKKIIFSFFALTLIISCNPEESSSTDDSTAEIDTTAPVASITGLDFQLEVITTINISIQESSNIKEISVRINEDEILNTTEKVFSIVLNPFDYPSGENTLKVISADSEGNQNEQSQTFEVNKLLASIASPVLIDNGRVFISANKMNGELISTIEVFRDFEIVKLYADDNFTEQPIIITSYVMLGENNFVISEIKSIANIKLGTDLVTFQENARAFTENTYNPNLGFEFFSFEVNEIESERIARSLYGDKVVGLSDFLDISTNSVTEKTDGFTSNMQGRKSSSSNFDNILLHTTNSTLDSSFERIKMEDYKYSFVENPSNQSISFSQFLSPDEIGNIQLPNTLERIFISVNGYKDESAFHNQNFSSIYTASLENISAVEIPIINNFNLIVSDIGFSINGFSNMSVSIVGEKNIEIPNWNAERNQGLILMTGDFDVFKLFTSKNFQGGDRIVSWEYFHKKQDQVNLNIESFEFPEIIKSLAEANQIDLESIKMPDSENVTLIGSSGNLDYEELLFDSQNGIPRPYNANPVDIYTLTTTLSSN
jgi:hypothetical protein